MAKYNLTLRERFLSHVFVPENLDDCWEWTASKFKTGYGQFKINYKMYSTHRVSFELFIGPIPKGLCVCHSCDNPGCVNPSHLWLGTTQDNTRDREKKNRHPHTVAVKGEDCWSHKLIEQEIYQIREMLEHGYTQQEIANVFGVTQKTISNIKTGRKWRWLK